MELFGTLVCVWQEREETGNKHSFQHPPRYEETGPRTSSSSLLSLNFNMYKSLILPLHPGEGSCHWDAEWKNLESTSGGSQSATQCLRRIQGGTEKSSHCYTIPGMLLSQKNKQSASEVRVFHIFLDYSFLLPILTTQPTKPSFLIKFFLFNAISYLMLGKDWFGIICVWII